MLTVSLTGSTSILAMHMTKTEKIVCVWNMLTCIVTVVDIPALCGFYEDIIDQDVLFGDIEWFWIITVLYILFTNFQSGYLFY